MKKTFTIIFLLCTLVSLSQSTTVVISQAYGGGGSTVSASYLFDYVELHNVSSSSQSLTGFSIQYGSASGNFGSSAGAIFAFPAGTSMPAGSYLLIQCGPTGTAGSAFPVLPDFITPNLNMSGLSGKVVLTNQITSLGCGGASLCTLPASSIIDLVSYGAATNAEGGVAVNNGVALTSTQGSVRKMNGCQDTNNNNADFDVVSSPVPRNAASTIVSCGPSGPTLTVTGTLTNFGTVFIGSNSTSQSYNLSGTDLTGAPGSITVSAPSTDFEVSNNNSTWGATTTIAYTSATLAATPVWVRFSPQSAGAKSGNVTNLGGGVTTAVNVAVSGTGAVIPTAPVFATTSLTAFGNVCLNTTAGPNSFTISGNNLTTADITVGSLNGFVYSTTAAGTYSPSLTFTQTGGVFSQQVFVQFTPVAIQSYDGNIVVSGGGAPSINVAASGAGNNNAPTLTTGAASAITINSATLAGSINATGCTAVTGYGFEYSLVNGFTNGTVVTASNLNAGAYSANLSGLNVSSTYYYKAFATNAGGTAYGVQRSFNTAAPVLTATPLTAFGASCLNIVTGPNSFTIASAGLNTSNVNVGPLAGYSFSTTQTGTYTNSLSLTQPGGAFSQIIFVKFTPVASQSYNGNIPVSGGGANTLNVVVSGSGVNAAPTVTTGSATGITANEVVLAGAVAAIGCSNVTSYGIEYSSISGFADGHGIKVGSSNISGTGFTTSLKGLVQATTYFYKAYAINNGGVAYGTEESFTTVPIPDGLTVYSSPIQRGGTLHYSLKSVLPGHYAAKLYNVSGQLVYRKDMILQVNFIDDSFVIPSNIGIGVYSLEIERVGFKTRKVFMIR